MDELWRAGIAAVVASTSLALVAALVARWWRRDDAAWWHRVYCVIMAASLAAPVGGWLLPGVRIAWHTTATPVASPAPGVWSGALAGLYAIGLAAMAVRLAMALAAVRRLRRDSHKLDEQWRQRVSEVAGNQAGCCRWHPHVRAPLTAGWLTPLVVLPRTALQWPVDRLRAVLHHELAHVRRHDYAFHIIAAVQVAVFWPSPAAWWLARQARLAAEVACDRAAAAVIGEAEYARVLVQSAREFVADGYGPGLVAPGAGTDLFARVEVLLTPRAPLTPLRGAGPAMLLGGIGLIMLMAGVVHVAPIPGPRPDVEPGIHAVRHDALHRARHR